MELNVVSFNVWCFSPPGKNHIFFRGPRLMKVLRKTDADIIGLQENTPKMMKHLVRSLGKKYEIYNVYRAKHNLESTPILWKKDRFECLDKGCFWLSDTPDVESQGWDETKCYRVCLWAKLKDRKTGKVFTFMNTHFGFGEQCQLSSVDLIHKYNLEKSPFPTVITGDFNMRPDFAAYKAMTELYTDVNMATAKDMGNTFHGYHPEQNSDALIDYCFVDDGFKPVNYRRITDTFLGLYPTDHYGVQAIIEAE